MMSMSSGGGYQSSRNHPLPHYGPNFGEDIWGDTGEEAEVVHGILYSYIDILNPTWKKYFLSTNIMVK